MTSPRIFVYHPNADRFQSWIQDIHPESDVVVGFDEAALERHLPDAEILLTFGRLKGAALSKATKLRWLQTTSAGIDSLVAGKDALKNVTVTNARGLHADIIGDYVIGAITMLHWGFPGLLRDQANKNWNYHVTPTLNGRTLGIVGLGAIGAEVARRAEAMKMRVIGVRRSSGHDGVDHVYSVDRLNDVLAECDFVVLLVPGTAETDKLIGEAQLAAMKKTAFLINVSRGSVVDEPALVAALRKGTIAGAMLDVFEKEPLPPDSPLWEMPNVVMTAHIAGSRTDYDEGIRDIFLDNLERYLSGATLRNQVDVVRGY